jgi:hypothetical protein
MSPSRYSKTSLRQSAAGPLAFPGRTPIRRLPKSNSPCPTARAYKPLKFCARKGVKVRLLPRATCPRGEMLDTQKCFRALTTRTDVYQCSPACCGGRRDPNTPRTQQHKPTNIPFIMERLQVRVLLGPLRFAHMGRKLNGRALRGLLLRLVRDHFETTGSFASPEASSLRPNHGEQL